MLPLKPGRAPFRRLARDSPAFFRQQAALLDLAPHSARRAVLVTDTVLADFIDLVAMHSRRSTARRMRLFHVLAAALDVIVAPRQLGSSLAALAADEVPKFKYVSFYAHN